MDEGRPFPLARVGDWAWDGGRRPNDLAPGGECLPPPDHDGHSDRQASLNGEADRSQPAAADPVVALASALNDERNRLRRLQREIQALLAGSRGMRRELLALRVRHWRDEATIRDLKLRLAEAQRDRASRRGGLSLVDPRRLLALAGQLRRGARCGSRMTRQPLLPGPGPFFTRGFQFGDTTTIVGGAVRRTRGAPSGSMVYGPYIPLPSGPYTATIEARLYRPIPTFAMITIEIVCDHAQQLIESRRFVVHPLSRRHPLELPFRVLEGEDHPDFEVRIWARRGTAVEITGLDLYRLTEAAQAETGSGTAGGVPS